MASTSSVPDAPISTEEAALKALTFQRLHPKAFLERFLAENARPDGREPAEWRDVSVNVGSISTADGSALVRLGDTTVVCGVKAEIAEPELDSPEDGFLVPNVDLPAICSPRFRPGPPSDEAQVLSDRLNEILVATEVVSTRSLCIESGKAVWVLYIDATCINYDGNAFDATLIAMVAALQNTRLPKATFDEDTGKVVCTRKEKTPLQIGRFPLSVSFGIFDGTHVLTDPTSFEEPLLDTTFTVVVDENGGVVSVVQLGLASQDVLQKCIATAKSRCIELGKQVYAAS
ncbi:ribosomal protein S5 domain 2-like protein [Phanerochaete sordida]|uniref:Ribosomal RNA-processing protein 43 n=1 Tax=Phanerochaete sordida TaxID=48140 RepID=A0A9P3L9P9_9APHY|nr:ribosomal protein S5 domain 2-like protein [Phanerochaete sordida]